MLIWRMDPFKKISSIFASQPSINFFSLLLDLNIVLHLQSNGQFPTLFPQFIFSMERIHSGSNTNRLIKSMVVIKPM
jgi:hypothetical protein